RRQVMMVRTLIVSMSVFALGHIAQAQPSTGDNANSTSADATPTNELLLSAYKREFAFLEAERDALKKRLAAIDERMKLKIRRARSAVETTQSIVAGQDLEISTLQSKLEAVEVEADVEETPEALITSINTRASSALVQLGLPKLSRNTKPADVLSGLTHTFDTVQRALAQGRQVSQLESQFFDVEGTLVSGSIYRVGYVASYGITPDEAGMLRPAGAGRLQLVQDEAGNASARSITSNNGEKMTSLFLYENLEKAIEMPEEKTAQSIVEAGGVIAYVIAALGLLVGLLLIGRVAMLMYYATCARRVVRVLAANEESNGDRNGERLASLRGPHARVLSAVWASLRRPRQTQLDTFTQAFLDESPRLDRFSALILVLAAIAPLLGLLGTVTGMIATFDTITQFGTGNPKLLSGGISEALITTELGLIVAIPAVLFGNLLKGWSDQMKDRIEYLCLTAMNRVETEGVHLVVDEFSTAPKSPVQSNVLAS
ncbi:MAG: MotA/TolQ/ExbB proton channel family protein, partial [Bradymonadia bacterium]